MVAKKDEDIKKNSDFKEPFDKSIHEPSRLRIMAQLFVVEKENFIALKVQTGLTWGNLSSHVTKLEEKGYVNIEKEFKGKKPQSWASLTSKGKAAFKEYMENIQIYFAKMAEEVDKK